MSIRLAVVLDYFVKLICVPRCAGCDKRLDPEQKDCLCEDCRFLYESAKERECARCGKRLDTCTCPTPNLQKNRIRLLTKLVYYHPRSNNLAVNKMIFKLKKTSESRLVDMFSSDLARTIAPIVEGNKEKYVVTYAPRTKKAIKKYGYDHMELLSRKVADILDLPWERYIIRRSGKEQKTLSFAQRLSNVNVEFKAGSHSIRGKYVILIDDIITTSATISACAKLLRKNGAKSVIPSVISVSYSAYEDFSSYKKKKSN